MNCAFGLIDPLEVRPGEKRIRNKQQRYEKISGTQHCWNWT